MINIKGWNFKFPDGSSEEVFKAVENGCTTMGKYVMDLEIKLAAVTGYKYVVCMTNGSICLLSLMISLINKKNGVFLAPNRSWLCTTNAARILKHDIYIIDSKYNQPIINITKSTLDDINKIRPNLVMLANINGFEIPNKELVIDICNELSIPLIFDKAQSFMSGTQNEGIASFFSMGITKLLAAGQGGFIGTNDEQLNHELRLIRVHGSTNPFHRESQKCVGLNFRLTDLHAVLAIKVLENIDYLITSNKTVISLYQKFLSELIENETIIPLISKSKGTFSIYVELLVKRRDKLMQFLRHKGVDARPLFKSLHYYKNDMVELHTCGDQIASERFDINGISLPCGPAITPKEIELVCIFINNFYKDKDSYE